MIAAWAVYAVLVGLALGLAGLGLETVARRHGGEGRPIWGAVILGTVTLPHLPQVWLPAGLEPEVVEPKGPLFHLGWVWSDEPALILCWAAASLAALAWLGAPLWRLRRRARGWRSAELHGSAVLLAPDIGPAVIGCLRPRIVVPPWVATLDPARLAMVLEHERIHAGRRDPLWLSGAALALVLLPWNPALWWQLARLRLAIELDCDQRLLGDGTVDLRRYAALLLEVAGRPRGGGLAPGFGGRSLLERRLRAMTAPRASSPLAGTGLGAACLGLSLLAVALPNPVNTGCPPMVILGALPAAAQEPAYASAETRDVIERMVEAHGGMTAWREAPSLAYDVIFFNPYAAAGENPWWIYREVVEQRTRRAYHAWPVEGARLGYDGARVWTTDWAVDNMPEFMVHFFYYFVNLPWLSQDDGIRLGPVERVRLPGIPTDLLAVPWTFDSAPTVGKTARDSYRLFIEPESHLLRGYEYSIAYPPMIQAMGLPAGGVMGPILRIHDAFTEVGGLRFPSRFRTLSPDGETTYGHHVVTNYSVTEPFDETRLAPPAGAVVARSDAAGPSAAGRIDLSGWVVPAVGAGVVLLLLAGLGLRRRRGLRRGGAP